MRLSAKHGYVGMYVVDKDYRGLGIGLQVWNEALKHLGPRNIGLSAVAHLFTLYRDKAGFGHVADWTVNLYKLDNMAVIFDCKHHQARHQFRWSKANNHKLNHSLFEYYRNSSDCQRDNGGAALGAFKSPENECNFFCLIQEYKSTERKYSKQGKTNKSIEMSDDESYGFSSLFFEDQSNDEISDLEEEPLEVLPERDPLSGKQLELAPLGASRMLECRLKLRHYCNSYHCSNGKLRTIVMEAENERLVEDVVEYDRKMHSYDRARIVRLTLREDNCLARVALLGQTVLGYACVKPNLQNMWIISPLYADNEYVARMLLLDLVTDLIFFRKYSRDPKAKPSIVLKSPSNNLHAAKLLESLGFVKQEYSLRRCYTKQVFEVPTQAIYALHTSVFCTE